MSFAKINVLLKINFFNFISKLNFQWRKDFYFNCQTLHHLPLPMDNKFFSQQQSDLFQKKSGIFLHIALQYCPKNVTWCCFNKYSKFTRKKSVLKKMITNKLGYLSKKHHSGNDLWNDYCEVNSLVQKIKIEKPNAHSTQSLAWKLKLRNPS